MKTEQIGMQPIVLKREKDDSIPKKRGSESTKENAK